MICQGSTLSTKILIAILWCTAWQTLGAQTPYTRFVVHFTDKNHTPYQLSDPGAFLSQRAIDRRAKQQIALDSTDLPVNPEYLDSIAAVPQVEILNVSKWLNQVLIRTTDTNAISTISRFPFVKKSEPVALRSATANPETAQVIINKTERTWKNQSVLNDYQHAQAYSGYGKNGNAVNYGSSYAQIHMHEGEYLHNLGFTGQGMIIAVLDAGFRDYLTNPAFDSLLTGQRVLATYDYVNQKTSVNEEDPHGAYCLSIMAANEPGIMTGTAPGAGFLLLKTEDVNSEYPVEEQNWAAAAEFADSAGADLISTSLGYDYFDDPVFNQDYPQRDGRSTLITRAANLAVAKGMVVTASAGNSGEATDDSKFIGCPADGDSVTTIGATDSRGLIAPFSSWGPNASGQIKPDFVSTGEGTVLAQSDGSTVLGNGTSFSNPNLAGLIACLWEAFPEFSCHDIIAATRKTAGGYPHPDNRYGYGIPNFRLAYQDLLNQRIFRAYIQNPALPSLSAYPVPFHDQLTVVCKPAANAFATFRLLDAGGRLLESRTIQVTANQYISVVFSLPLTLSPGVYMVQYDDGQLKKTLKAIRL